MAEVAIQFGVAVRNFTASPEEPDIDGIIHYVTRAEELGFHSAWVWDHILLGSKRPFPFLDSLVTLAALATRTTRLQLGTGVLILPLRNPVVLAKELASLDQISKGRLVLGLATGWYEREFDACGVPHKERGNVFLENLDIILRLWTEPAVNGEAGRYHFKQAVMLPRPLQQPRPPLLIGGYVDVVLRRVAERADGWLTYFYTPESFRRSWAKIQAYAAEAGRDPAGLRNVSQLPIYVAHSFEEADRGVREFIGQYFDVAPWSESTVDSAIRGTPEQCAEQVQAHLSVGVEHVVFVPYGYQLEQLDLIASEVIPRLALRRAEARA